MGFDPRDGLAIDDLFDSDGSEIPVAGFDPRVIKGCRALQADAHEAAVDAYDRVEVLFGTAQRHSS